MSASQNRWIISRRRFHEHRTPQAMEAELKRLKDENPGVEFHVYRIKRASDQDTEAEPASSLRLVPPPPAPTTIEKGGVPAPRGLGLFIAGCAAAFVLIAAAALATIGWHR